MSHAEHPVGPAAGRSWISVGELGEAFGADADSHTLPRVAHPGLAHCAASKAGLNGFIRSAALELAGEGITVNGVEPGMIATPAAANLGDGEHQQRLARRIPLGRLGRPEDIAFAMLFLRRTAPRTLRVRP